MINNLYILLDDLVCSMAEHFYKLCPFFFLQARKASQYTNNQEKYSVILHT